MERLTKRIGKDAVHFDCHGTCGTCDGCTCFEIGGMVDRLAAYEDTGLEPAGRRIIALVEGRRCGMGVAMKRNKFWACPFFKWDGKQEISCEGGRAQFPNPETANAYMNEYCAGDWKKCSVAASLLKYYETEEKKP